MVIVLEPNAAVTPAGKPLAAPIPVARVVVCVMAVSAVFIQGFGVDEAAVTVMLSVTVIVPVAFTVPQPPVKVTVYGNETGTLGGPFIVTTLADQLPDTPEGKPLKVAPVAPVVVKVILLI